jgi:hypothetical protein
MVIQLDDSMLYHGKSSPRPIIWITSTILHPYKLFPKLCWNVFIQILFLLLGNFSRCFPPKVCMHFLFPRLRLPDVRIIKRITPPLHMWLVPDPNIRADALYWYFFVIFFSISRKSLVFYFKISHDHLIFYSWYIILPLDGT